MIPIFSCIFSLLVFIFLPFLHRTPPPALNNNNSAYTYIRAGWGTPTGYTIEMSLTRRLHIMWKECVHVCVCEFLGSTTYYSSCPFQLHRSFLCKECVLFSYKLKRHFISSSAPLHCYSHVLFFSDYWFLFGITTNFLKCNYTNVY